MRRWMPMVLAGVLLAAPAFPMSDAEPSPEMRAKVQNAMRRHIAEHQVNGAYVLYDALAGGFRHLRFKELHPGVVKIAGFYVSCADFVAEDGALYDVDFMAAADGGGYKVYQDLIHAVDGRKRAYHRER